METKSDKVETMSNLLIAHVIRATKTRGIEKSTKKRKNLHIWIWYIRCNWRRMRGKGIYYSLLLHAWMRAASSHAVLKPTSIAAHSSRQLVIWHLAFGHAIHLLPAHSQYSAQTKANTEKKLITFFPDKLFLILLNCCAPNTTSWIMLKEFAWLCIHLIKVMFMKIHAIVMMRVIWNRSNE